MAVPKFILGDRVVNNGDIFTQNEILRYNGVAIDDPPEFNNYTFILANLETRKIHKFWRVRPYPIPPWILQYDVVSAESPGIYILYLFDSTNTELPDLPREGNTLDNINPKDLGKLVAKVIYIIRPNYRIDLSKFNAIYKLPRELKQKVLLEGDFDIFEILYLCQRDTVIDQQVCNDTYFWKQYASTRLSINLPMNKEQIISDLKLASYLTTANRSSVINLDILNRMINYDIFMRKLFTMKDLNQIFELPDRYARSDRYQNQLPFLLSYFSQNLLFQYATTYLPQVNDGFPDLIGGTPENYRYLVEKVIEALDDEHFIQTIETLINTAKYYYRPLFEIILEYIEEGERDELRRRFEEKLEQ
jgi:hypothetical protein